MLHLIVYQLAVVSSSFRIECIKSLHYTLCVPMIIGRFYYLIFQTGASRQNLIKPRLSAFSVAKLKIWYDMSKYFYVIYFVFFLGGVSD